MGHLLLDRPFFFRLFLLFFLAAIHGTAYRYKGEDAMIHLEGLNLQAGFYLGKDIPGLKQL